MNENKQVAFLNYAKSKKWDASLMFFNGEYMAILNPIDDPKTFEGKSDLSIGDAIDLCKEDLIKGRK